MDDTSNPTGTTERSAEEIAWDQEFNNSKENNPAAVLTDLARLAVQVPVAILQMPMNLLPDETARHARAAAREGFLAVRSLLGAIGDKIEDILAEPGEKPATVSGPAGTWGSARYGSTSSTTATSTKLKRISLADEEEPSASDTGETASEQGRGLKADIDY